MVEFGYMTEAQALDYVKTWEGPCEHRLSCVNRATTVVFTDYGYIPVCFECEVYYRPTSKPRKKKKKKRKG